MRAESCRRVAFWIAILVVMACTGGVAMARADEPPRQLLVTIAVPPHADPGAHRDFRRPPRYGGGARVDAALDTLAREHGLRRSEGWPIQALSVYCAVFELDGPEGLDDALSRLRADPRVESVQPMLVHRTLAAAPASGRHERHARIDEPVHDGPVRDGPVRDESVRDDPVRDVSVHDESLHDDPMLALQTSFAALRLGAAHALSRGAGVRVAVIDSGIDRRHPELRGRIAHSADFTGGQAMGQHGTAVAGLIGARAGNGIGIVGVAPEARLLELRACWPVPAGGLASQCTSLTLARALDAAIAQDADVIALSLAGPDDPLLGRLIAAAVARGASVVAAAGGPDAFPASRTDVIAVAAAPVAMQRSRAAQSMGAESMRAQSPHTPTTSAAAPHAARIVHVPASGVLTTFPDRAFDYVSGDSFAAAQVAGLVALLRAREPGLSPRAVHAALLAQQPLDAVALLRAPATAIAAP